MNELYDTFLTDMDQILLDSINYIDSVQQGGAEHDDAVLHVLANYEMVLRHHNVQDKLVGALVSQLGEGLASYYQRETNG